MIKILSNNRNGKLWAVGDLHGCYTAFMNLLKKIGFDFENDLVVAVGDLVDRGSENIECIELIFNDWFKAIQGNHEDLCIYGLINQSHKDCHIANGGQWFYDLNRSTQLKIIEALVELPIALEVEHKNKKYGFVHGHIEQNDWNEFKSILSDHKMKNHASQRALWGRERLGDLSGKYTHVEGIEAVVMGHSVVNVPYKQHNCYYIDVGSTFTGRLAIMDMENLKVYTS